MRHALLLAVTCLLVTLCGANAAADEYTVDWELYHTKDAIFQALEDIVGTQQAPESLAITSETGKDGNYSSKLTVVTVEPGSLTGEDEKKIRLLLNFGEHGRELITNEVALQLLQLLAHDDKLAAFCQRQGIPLQPLLAALMHTVIKVVPMENPRGRERVEAGEVCLRTNGRDVDINRNWGVHWGHKEADYDPKEEYPGTAPFSEPEAVMMKALATGFKPHVWVNVHSGMEALFLPYDHRAEVPKGPGPKAALEILHELNRTMCGGRCAVGSGGKSVGYLAHGTATDYMFEELGIAMAYTWEIYGDTKATYTECFRMFNPSTKQEIEKVVTAWTSAFLRLILLLPSHPAVAKDSPAMVKAIQEGHREAKNGGTVATAANAAVASGDAAADSGLADVGNSFGTGSVDALAAQPADAVEDVAEVTALARLREGSAAHEEGAALQGGRGTVGWWQPPFIAVAIMLTFVCVFQRRPVWRRLSGGARLMAPRRRAPVGV